MIRCNLADLLASRDRKISDVVRHAGINRKTATRLYHNTNNRIDYDTIEKVCRYLKCDIGDLFTIVDEDKKEPRSESTNER